MAKERPVAPSPWLEPFGPDPTPEERQKVLDRVRADEKEKAAPK